MSGKPLPCHICRTPATVWEEPTGTVIECPRCGVWTSVSDGQLSVSALVTPGGKDLPNRRARLSQIVRRQQRDAHHAVSLFLAQLSPAVLDEPPSNPAQLLNDLVLWIAGRQTDFASDVELPDLEVLAWIGAPIVADAAEQLDWLISAGSKLGLIEHLTDKVVQLTLSGWVRADELRRTAADSRLAFMAMQFGDEALNHALSTCFKPAALAAGFDLRTVNDKQGAGLIDDQIRVGLRRARFVVADLTHENRGAYWEAGFAEGAGKPVIYTCRRAEWDQQQRHFDTNHLATIVWDTSELADAEKRMTAMIRATLPAEARLDD